MIRRNLKLVILFSVVWCGGFLYYFNAPGRQKVGHIYIYVCRLVPVFKKKLNVTRAEFSVKENSFSHVGEQF